MKAGKRGKKVKVMAHTQGIKKKKTFPLFL